jgi:hypothetical protein
LEFITNGLSECGLDGSWRGRLTQVRGDLSDGTALEPQANHRPNQPGSEQDDCRAFNDEDALRGWLGGVLERR